MEVAALESLRVIAACTKASELPGCIAMATVGLECVGTQSSYTILNSFLKEELQKQKERYFSNGVAGSSDAATMVPGYLLFFSTQCTHLLSSCCQLTAAALGSRSKEFHSEAATVWSQLVEEMLQSSVRRPLENEEEEEVAHSVISREECIRVLQVVFAVAKVAEEGQLDEEHNGRSSYDWLCRDSLSPSLHSLAQSLPDTLHESYKEWLASDLQSLQRQPVNSAQATPLCSSSSISVSEAGGGGGKIFQCVRMLTDCVTLLATVAKAYSSCRSFCRSATETLLRLTNHYWEELVQMVKMVPSKLPVKVLFLALNSAHHLHSSLSTLLPLEKEETLQDSLASLQHCLGEFCSGMLDHVISYHAELCVTSLLQDAASNDWTSHKPFFEGERCSFTVQMWHLHLQALQHDAWELLDGGIATKVLGKVLRSTLHFLTLRYTTINPSDERSTHFRANVFAILLATASILPSLPLPQSLLPSLSSPHQCSHDIAAIHGSCQKLLNVLSAIERPLEGRGDSEPYLTKPCEDAERQEGGIASSVKWVECLQQQLDRFAIPRVFSLPREQRLVDWLSLCSLPAPPNWALLLKVLLNGGATLPAFLCTCEDGEVLRHVARILAGCHQSPWVLSGLCKHCLSTSVAGDNHHKKTPPPQAAPNGDMGLLGNHRQRKVDRWLAKSSLLQESFVKTTSKMSKVCLQLYQRSFCSSGNRAEQEDGDDSGEMDELLQSCLEELQRGVADLPQAVINLLWTATELPSTSDGGGSGIDGNTLSSGASKQLAKVVGGAYREWLSSAAELVPDPLHSVLAAFASSVQQATASALSGERGGGGGGGGATSDGSCANFAEHEAAVDVMLVDKRMRESLLFVYHLMLANKQAITEFLEKRNGTERPHPLLIVLPSNNCKQEMFNPLSAHCKLHYNALMNSHAQF